MSVATNSGVNGSDVISALHLSQQAPAILGYGSGSNAKAKRAAGTAEDYGQIEKLLLACLRTGDDASALACLDRLSHRFGPSNERVMGLRGLYQEAVAKDRPALEKCLEDYERILLETPVNMPIMKRRAALLRSLNRPSDAIASLVQLLDAVPTDAEAWCELADLYQSQGLGSQAVFSLEEALLIAPNAWNIHARLGELLYTCAFSSDDDVPRLAGKSVQHFCRSVELCDDYLRGFYGLASVTSRMLENQNVAESSSPSAAPSRKTLTQLKDFALQKLEEIIKTRSVDDQHWASNRSEVIAARELLNRLTAPK
ncbi:hypothetical protein N7462_011577 [Penicillium macrosclerotiorum]|uniref:uncharacterized protein n=1 Tax=Penicillium macrosclerotiorum TaxID=303699 RepID=UPI0025492088|nr:uncharacterized protein N7462_011577 [Penicillium macrosclerotiorum]KAJ5664764.1 hypothetical protein N7462_011577 [Penicillium macrosclerotiorum]